MDKIKIFMGGIITVFSGFVGGIDGIMYALLVCISVDYITGVAVAIKRQELSSEIGFWGLVRKVCILLLIAIGHYLDAYVIGSGDAFRIAVTLYYIGNEGVFLLENCSNLGLPLPPKLVAVLKQIKGKGENDDDRSNQK